MKKSIYQILSILLPLFLLPSCTDDEHVLSLLDHAEAVMEEHPDSAYTMLTEADSLIPQQSKKTRMRHSILMADANNKLYQPLPSDTLFQEVVDYYDTHGTPNQQLKAHYLLGCIYRDRNEAPQALTCYNDAVEKADTLSEDCDYTTLFSIYGQMADILHNQIMSEEEIEALKQYSKYALKAGNVYEHIRSFEYMASAFSLTGDTAMILSTEKQAHDLFIRYGFIQDAAHACTISMYIYLNRNEYEKVGKMMKQLEKQSMLFDVDGNIKQGWEHYYHTKGRYYMGIGQLDSAEFYFKRLLNHGNSFDGHRGLMHVSMEKGLADSVVFYATEYEKSLDTLVTEMHAQATRQAVGMYDYTRHQKIAMEKAAESERNRNIIYLMIVVVTISASLLYHLYRRAKEKKQREIAMLSHRYMDTLTQYERTKEELGMMGQDFMSFRQRKEKELSELQAQMEDYQTHYGNLGQAERLEALKQSPLWEAFLDRLNPKKKTKPITNKEWKDLSSQFSQCIPQLYAQMTDNNILSQHELHVTILTRMGLHTSEIAILLDMPLQRITNARASANGKLFSDNSARTFLNHLCKI